MKDRHFAVCGVVFINEKILLVRHTYGTAKDRLLLPGGYVKEHELPTAAIEREIFEETSIRTKANSVISVQFKPDQWCIFFMMNYISGTPQSDNYENSEVVLLTPEEVLKRSDVTNTSRKIITAIYENNVTPLSPSDFCPPSAVAGAYEIFGV